MTHPLQNFLGTQTAVLRYGIRTFEGGKGAIAVVLADPLTIPCDVVVTSQLVPHSQEWKVEHPILCPQGQNAKWRIDVCQPDRLALPIIVAPILEMAKDLGPRLVLPALGCTDLEGISSDLSDNFPEMAALAVFSGIMEFWDFSPPDSREIVIISQNQDVYQAFYDTLILEKPQSVPHDDDVTDFANDDLADLVRYPTDATLNDVDNLVRRILQTHDAGDREVCLGALNGISSRHHNPDIRDYASEKFKVLIAREQDFWRKLASLPRSREELFEDLEVAAQEGDDSKIAFLIMKIMQQHLSRRTFKSLGISTHVMIRFWFVVYVLTEINPSLAGLLWRQQKTFTEQALNHPNSDVVWETMKMLSFFAEHGIEEAWQRLCRIAADSSHPEWESVHLLLSNINISSKKTD